MADFLGDLLGDMLSDVVARKTRKGMRRVLGRPGPADSGNGCALKILSGRQDGLSQQWRPGGAHLAPGELSFTQSGHASLPITVLNVLETADQVNIPRLGACRIAQLQTPTAALALAMPAGQLTFAVQDLARRG
jgi:hypothetical protein